MKMKKPIVAFTLSFLLPGAGLAYLGKWKWAVINLLGVLLIGVTAVFSLSEELFEKYIRLISVFCSSGSSAVAYALTMQMNQKGRTDSAA